MEIINFIGANPSKDGKWLLVTFARKGTNEKFRWILPYGTGGKLPVACKEDDRYKISLALTSYKKIEEPKEEPKEELEDIPF